MKTPDFHQTAPAIAIFIFWLVFYFVKKEFGAMPANHWMGAALLVIAIVMATRPTIAIYSGFRKAGSLTGCRKAIVIVPIAILAIVVITR